jgi:Ca2+-binding RTX toxin-like protein
MHKLITYYAYLEAMSQTNSSGLAKLIISSLLLIGGLLPVMAVNVVWADNDDDDDDNDDDNGNSRQFSDLETGVQREENVQGDTIVGSTTAEAGPIIEGTNHADTILGTILEDIIYAKGGDDVVMGNDGNDRIFGGAGDDLLQGNFGDDKIDGEGRNDVIIGGDADDILSGDDGNDKLFGVFGNDILKGGPGADEFVCGEGIDTVLDYNPGQGDTLSNDCEIVHRI